MRLCQEYAVFFWVQNDYFWAYFGLKFGTGDPRECPRLVWEPSGVPWTPFGSMERDRFWELTLLVLGISLLPRTINDHKYLLMTGSG